MVLRLIQHELRANGATPALWSVNKSEAQALAKANGWNKSDVMRVLVTRMQIGWVIVDAHLGVLCEDGQRRQLAGEFVHA
jgi:hypothetical protein